MAVLSKRLTNRFQALSSPTFAHALLTPDFFVTLPFASFSATNRFLTFEKATFALSRTLVRDDAPLGPSDDPAESAECVDEDDFEEVCDAAPSVVPVVD